MNKAKIDELLPKAYDVLKETEIAKNGEIDKTYRGYIATFGAAISGGSLLAAIAFFSDRGEAKCDRTKLMKALYRLAVPDREQLQLSQVKENTLFEYIKNEISINAQPDIAREKEWKNKIMDAAISLKLAMNLYKLERKEEKR